MNALPSYILGISAFYHDSAAALICDGKIVAAAQEERFTRKKHDASFPENAINFVLAEYNLQLSDISCIAFYDKPWLKFERLLETYHAFAPHGLKSFLTSMPVWIKDKFFFRSMLEKHLRKIGNFQCEMLFPEHHLSHAASAFYPSPFDEAAILTVDGVGEWATSTIGKGKGHNISILRELHFPHSLGLLYTAFTYFLGFKPNSGEYKVMGLAPYVSRENQEVMRLKNIVLKEMVDVRKDGSLLLNMKFFRYATGLTMTHDEHWKSVLGIERRQAESPLEIAHIQLAMVIQQITEDVMVKMAKTAKALTGAENLVMAGGVALNCVANGYLRKQKIFKNIWIQPAAGDAGGAIGAALAGYFLKKAGNNESQEPKKHSRLNDVFLGPSFPGDKVVKRVEKYGAVYQQYPAKELYPLVADYLNEGKIVGWFQGKMEFGPRALGNRSILADARNPEMQKKLNLSIKFREGFRPFAPAMLEEDSRAYFDSEENSPFMLFVDDLKDNKRLNHSDKCQPETWKDQLKIPRSELPAVTHIDYSARLQTVNQKDNLKFWKLLQAFKKITGVGALINTSFNVRGEPVVCNPEDAYRCFLRSGMDILVMGNYVFLKEQQSEAWINKIREEEIMPD